MKVILSNVSMSVVMLVATVAGAQTVDLANPVGRQIATGAVSGGHAGRWLAVGDVNGDINNKDLIVGSPNVAGDRGEVRLLFGWLRQTGDFSLSLADVVLAGAAAGDRFGAAADAGFITHRETIPATAARDLIVGAPGASGGRGEVYVFAAPLSSGTSLTASNALIRIVGAAGDALGSAVESADLNNDGFREIIAGAPGTGRVYVIDYHHAPTAVVDLSTQAAAMTISGAGIGNVLTVGDLTGDSVFDLAIGAATAAGGNGEVYVVNGRSAGSLPSSLTLPAGANSTFRGADPGDHAGASAWIKDFDGDGLWDLAIGAPDADGPANGRPDAGEAYVIFGRPSQPAVLVANVTMFGAAAGLHTGAQVRSGDITKDEPDDIALLAPGGNGGFGETYVYYGRARGQFPSTVDLAVDSDRRVISDETQGAIESIAVWEVTGEGAEDLAFGVPSAASGSGRLYLSISPRITTTPDPLYIYALQGTGGSLPMAVQNPSAVAITWSVTSQANWLSVTPGTGTADGTNPGYLTLTVPNGFAAGSYAADIILASTSKHLASRQTIPVTFVVLAPGRGIGVNYGGDPGGDAFLYKPATGSWSIQLSAAGGFSPLNSAVWGTGWSVQPGDFNGDGLTDLFLYNSTSGQWFKAFSLGSGDFRFVGGTWAPNWNITILDLDGDGLSDAFLYNASSGQWFRAVSLAGGDFVYTTGRWAAGWTIYPADFNGDGLADLFIYNRNGSSDVNSGKWFCVLSQGDGSFAYEGGTIRWATDWNVTVGDFNGDHRSDLFLYRPGGQWFRVFFVNGAPTYESGLWGTGWTIKKADFDNNGVADLFLYNPANGRWFMVITQPDGSLAYYGGTWGTNWDVTVTDFDSDGRSDILLYNTSNGTWFKAITTGAGAFNYQTGSWGTGWTVFASRAIVP